MITNVDARGSTPDGIEALRRAMAERDARLPGQVLEMIKESRERGCGRFNMST